MQHNFSIKRPHQCIVWQFYWFYYSHGCNITICSQWSWYVKTFEDDSGDMDVMLQVSFHTKHKMFPTFSTFSSVKRQNWASRWISASAETQSSYQRQANPSHIYAFILCTTRSISTLFQVIVLTLSFSRSRAHQLLFLMLSHIISVVSGIAVVHLDWFTGEHAIYGPTTCKGWVTKMCKLKWLFWRDQIFLVRLQSVTVTNRYRQVSDLT